MRVFSIFRTRLARLFSLTTRDTKSILRHQAFLISQRVFGFALVIAARANGTYKFFDAGWYLGANPDVAKAGVPPFLHYFRHGRSEQRAPNGLVDPTWYTYQYRYILDGRDFWEHFFQDGLRQKLSPHPFFDRQYYADQCHDASASWIDLFEWRSGYQHKPSRFGVYLPATRSLVADGDVFCMSAYPLVSIIIVNRNGARLLPYLFDSINKQTYRNFEVIFVDNNSDDNSVEIARRDCRPLRLVESGYNSGFAEGNNIGYRTARGELLALVNSDVKLDSNWLETMIYTFLSDPFIAAATSRLRFWTKFVAIRLSSPTEFHLDVRKLTGSLAYKKIFTKIGRSKGDVMFPTVVDGAFQLLIFVPDQEKPYSFEIRTKPNARITVNDEYRRHLYFSAGTVIKFDYRIHRSDHLSFWVINNTGNFETTSHDIEDRGFGDADKGQYSQVEFVPSFCGAAAVVRRDALYKEKLFISELFCYFEDSDLSKRLINRGFKIAFCPQAIAYHWHAATSGEFSEFWLAHVWRNRAFYKYIHGPLADRAKMLRRELRRLTLGGRLVFGASEPIEMRLEELKSQLFQLITRSKDQELLHRSDKRVAIYNSFWNTYGGGEAHALRLGILLSRYGMVELLSEEDFDIGELGKAFDIKTDCLSKRLIKKITSPLTAEYDIFVNATYCNACASLAPISLYIVSFPSQEVTNEFLASYTFLGNSSYTMRWMHHYWGDNFRSHLYQPAIVTDVTADAMASKERIMLNVGRFFVGSHCKNQHLIVDAYKAVLALRPDLGDWKLVLIGGAGDDVYVDEIKKKMQGTPCHIIVNASRQELEQYYERAYIYIHAAGLGQDADRNPEKMEHFGLTVVEAMASGCYPIVYDIGGPSEIVSNAKVGSTFSSMDQLIELMISQAEIFSEKDTSLEQTRQIRDASRRYLQSEQDPDMEQFLNTLIAPLAT